MTHQMSILCPPTLNIFKNALFLTELFILNCIRFLSRLLHLAPIVVFIWRFNLFFIKWLLMQLTSSRKNHKKCGRPAWYFQIKINTCGGCPRVNTFSHVWTGYLNTITFYKFQLLNWWFWIPSQFCYLKDFFDCFVFNQSSASSYSQFLFVAMSSFYWWFLVNHDKSKGVLAKISCAVQCILKFQHVLIVFLAPHFSTSANTTTTTQ